MSQNGTFSPAGDSDTTRCGRALTCCDGDVYVLRLDAHPDAHALALPAEALDCPCDPSFIDAILLLAVDPNPDHRTLLAWASVAWRRARLSVTVPGYSRAPGDRSRTVSSRAGDSEGGGGGRHAQSRPDARRIHQAGATRSAELPGHVVKERFELSARLPVGESLARRQAAEGRDGLVDPAPFEAAHDLRHRRCSFRVSRHVDRFGRGGTRLALLLEGLLHAALLAADQPCARSCAQQRPLQPLRAFG